MPGSGMFFGSGGLSLWTDHDADCGFLIYGMGKLSDDGTLKIRNAIGKSGIVYLPIPPKRGGTGQVQIKVQGLQTLDAMTDDLTGFKTGQVVEVIEVLKGDILLVR